MLQDIDLSTLKGATQKNGATVLNFKKTRTVVTKAEQERADLEAKREQAKATAASR